MPLQIPRLRRWLLLATAVLCLIVAGAYIHRRRQAHAVFKEIPAKMNLEIQQTAEGFKVSKSEQGRTLFTVQASQVVQFKTGGRAELHHVTITLYGRDASRYDQIYGDDFAYDPQTGNVIAKGEVRIDLEANPEGILKPDQSKPEGMKNPIHLVTRDLVFNQKTGNAFTAAQVELRMPQATGSATGVHYTAKDNILTLDSHVDLALSGSRRARLQAARGVISKEPRQVVLEEPQLRQGPQQMQARRATLYLRDDNTVDHVVASNDVQARITGDSPVNARAGQAEFAVNEAQDGISRALLKGDVQIEAGGEHPSRINAGRIQLTFSGKNQVSKVRAEENVQLTETTQQNADSSAPAARETHPAAQQVEISAPAMDFYLANGERIDHAETSGGGRIAILPGPANEPSTIITAGDFQAKFDGNGRMSSIHGAPDAKIVTTAPGQPERSSSSPQIDATFRAAATSMASRSEGNFTYGDGNARRALTAPATRRETDAGAYRLAKHYRQRAGHGRRHASDESRHRRRRRRRPRQDDV
jgi:lipopolysaccharide export system protein LptA